MIVFVWWECWFVDFDGGGCFIGQWDLIFVYDQSCLFLNEVWFFWCKGVFCLSDFMECEICEIMFFWEGIVGLFDDCLDFFWYFCCCCVERVVLCLCGGDCVKNLEFVF